MKLVAFIILFSGALSAKIQITTEQQVFEDGVFFPEAFVIVPIASSIVPERPIQTVAPSRR